MVRAVLTYVRSLSMQVVAGFLSGSLLVPALLVAFAGQSALQFFGTWAATMLVSLVLFRLTGQSMRRQ